MAKGNRPLNDRGMIVHYRLKSGTQFINSMISMESFRWEEKLSISMALKRLKDSIWSWATGLENHNYIGSYNDHRVQDQRLKILDESLFLSSDGEV